MKEKILLSNTDLKTKKKIDKKIRMQQNLIGVTEADNRSTYVIEKIGH